MCRVPGANKLAHRHPKKKLALAGQKTPGSHWIDLLRGQCEQLWGDEQNDCLQGPVSPVQLLLLVLYCILNNINQLCLSGNFFSLFVLRTGWNRISALSLFVENIVLGIEEVRETLTPLVLGHTRRLAQVGLSTMEFPVLLSFLNTTFALDTWQQSLTSYMMLCLCSY